MKYMIESTIPPDHSDNYSITIDEVVDELAYDESINDLVVVGKINLQEKIQSFGDCALDKILDKFLGSLPPDQQADSFPVVDGVATDISGDDVLLSFGDFLDDIELYRSKFDLSQELSYSDVLNKIGDYSKDLKVKLDNLLKKGSVVNEISQENS